MTLRYTNNAQSSLAQALSASATSLSLPAGEGARFPQIAAGDNAWFPLTIIKSDGTDYEIVKATERDGDVITIVRGQENTPVAISFGVDDIVSLRMTADAFDEFAKSDDEGVYFKSLNLATQINATNDPIELSIANVAELYDGLSITFSPVANNVHGVSIKVNDLDTKDLRMPLSAQTALRTDELLTSRFYDMRFSTELDQWILETYVERELAFANALQAGIVETLHGANYYDPDNNIVSFSGAPKVPTQRETAQIIRDFATRIPQGYLPTQWAWKGDGVVHSNGGLIAHPFYAYHYASVNIPNGSSIKAGDLGTSVIRSKSTFSIGGQINIGVCAARFPEPYEGPRGSDKYYTDDTNIQAIVGAQPDYIPRQQRVSGGTSSYRSPSSLAAAILAGTPLWNFHGGHGAGHCNIGEIDPHVAGRSGLILIATDVVIANTAKVYMPTVAAIEQSPTDYAVTEKADNVQAPNTGRGGGGIIIIASETLSIDDNSQWLIDDKNASYKSYSAIKLDPLSPAEQQTVHEYRGAQMGQLFHLNLSTGEIQRLL